MTNVEVDLGQLKYQSLGDKAAEHIRAKIIRRELPPGMRMAEEQFAASLGVSRACVREAFMILEAEGLVRRVRNRYTEVVSFTSHDIEEILELRQAIEVLSAESCIKFHTVPVEEMKKQVEVITELDKRNGQDVEALMEADLDFHEMTVRASGNMRALGIWRNLKSQMKVLLFTALQNKSNPNKYKGGETHAIILKALEESDSVKATRLIKEHIENSTLASIALDTEAGLSVQ